MDTGTIAVYKKDYSELAGLQTAAHVEYRLRRTGADPLLEITLSTADRCGRKTASCHLHGMTEAFAEMLVRYVYENGVMPAQLRDVLQDCCGTCIR